MAVLKLLAFCCLSILRKLINCFKKNGLTSKAKVNGSKTYRALLVFRAAKAESFDKLLENYSLEK